MGPLLTVGCDLRQMCKSLPGAETRRPHQVQTGTELSQTKEQIREDESVSSSFSSKAFSDATSELSLGIDI